MLHRSKIIRKGRPVRAAARGALKTGADIIPVAVAQIGSRVIVHIGENIDPERYGAAGEMPEDLRTVLSTLKWEKFEYRGLCVWDAVQSDEWNRHLRDIWGSHNDEAVTVEEIERGKFRDKTVVTMGQVFGPLQTLEPGRQNAFLFQSIPQ